jgi:peptidoglycan/LPS O-acetylase OafA/YrhL
MARSIPNSFYEGGDRSRWDCSNVRLLIFPLFRAPLSRLKRWLDLDMRFHGLQVLRFVAAFSVVLYHSGLYAHAVLKYHSPLTEFLHHPAFGSAVFLFFTLSGFVIAHTLATVAPGRFFLLRAIRLYPAYWLAAALVLLTRYCLWAEVPPRGWASCARSW